MGKKKPQPPVYPDPNMGLILHAISTAARDAIIMIDQVGNISFWNRSACRVFGYAEDEVIGKNLHDLLVPDRFMEGYQQAFPIYSQTGQGAAIGQTLELWARHKEGREFPIELSLSSIKLRDQWHAIGIVQDITERKRAAAAYKKIEDRFRRAFELPLFGFAILAPGGALMEVNASLQETLGYSREELEQMTWMGLIHPDDLTAVRNQVRRMYTGEIENSINEMRILHKNGGIIWVVTSTACVRKEDQSVDYFIVTLQDITKRKQAQEEVLQERILLRTLIDNLPDTIYVKDIEGRKIIANIADLKFSGHSSEKEVIGKTDIEIYPGETGLRGHSEDMEILKNHRQIVNQEESFISGEGKELWLYTTKIPMLDEAGNLKGLVGIGRDFTKMKETERILEKQAEELKELNATKDKFFSIIAHDLRSPFGGFLNLTKIMAEELQDMSMEKIQEFATMMSKSASAVFGMLENLLEWSRMQRGQVKYEPVTFNLKEKICRFLTVVGPVANQKQIVIHMDIPDTLGVCADERMLESTIHNLVSNAIKFTGRGGQIFIEAHQDDDRSVVISVKDTGIGMSKKIVDQLFRIDENPSRPGTEGESSSGLGLLLCKEFVEKNGGKIWVESEEGLGSTFYIRLPDTL
ncbi:MAG: PAS domain S-box protein [Bacteroidales bacterium]|nr:PAS domain S-box protein [Bacteroidales bacterium]